jgi:hypothetical protein
MKSEEPQYGFNPYYSDKNQNNFHWRIILEWNVEKYPIQINNIYYKNIDKDIIDFMKQFPIELDANFHETNYDQINNCVVACNKFWNALMNE